MNCLISFLRKIRLVKLNNPLVISFWKDSHKGWRWRFTRSGKQVGEGGESYTNRQDCESTMQATIEAIRSGNVRIDN